MKTDIISKAYFTNEYEVRGKEPAQRHTQVVRLELELKSSNAIAHSLSTDQKQKTDNFHSTSATKGL